MNISGSTSEYLEFACRDKGLAPDTSRYDRINFILDNGGVAIVPQVLRHISHSTTSSSAVVRKDLCGIATRRVLVHMYYGDFWGATVLIGEQVLGHKPSAGVLVCEANVGVCHDVLLQMT